MKKKTKKEKIYFSPTRNRTRAFHVTSRDPHHYTIEYCWKQSKMETIN